jgi:hypothetical protein
MMPASYRVTWATRGSRKAGPVAVAVAGVVAGVAGVLTASGAGGARVGLWGAGFITLSLIALDFPGAGGAKGSEFELSLPLALRELIDARLAWALAFWVSPVVLAFALGALGLIPGLPLLQGLVATLSAIGSIVLAAVIAQALGLSAHWQHAGFVRGAALMVAAVGFCWPAAWVGPGALLLALALRRVTYRNAPPALELHLAAPEEAAPSWRTEVSEGKRGVLALEGAGASTESGSGGSMRGLVWRYCIGSRHAALLLVCIFVWAFWLDSMELMLGSIQGLLLFQWAVYHAAWSSRLLRLEPLPLDRERLFEFVVWPALIAGLLGLTCAAVVGLPQTLAKQDAEGISSRGPVTLQSSQQYWRLALGEVPVLVGPDEEVYRPVAHRFGLGSAVVAYDPYEAGLESSPALRVHQLGRLLAEHHRLTLTPDELGARLATPLGRRRTLTSDVFPELRPEQQRQSGARIILLVVSMLLAFHLVIRPGAARQPATRGARLPLGPRLTALLLALFIGPLLPALFSLGQVDLAPQLTATCIGGVADHLVLALPLAVVLAALLYRSLQRRFRQMEAPPRGKQWDNWFVEL